jgi:hypothetical protein
MSDLYRSKIRESFRFQISGFRFQVSGFRFQVSGFQDSDFIISGFSIKIAVQTIP